MSIGVLVTVHDGLVLAADSASTLTLSGVPTQPGPVALNVYNNANKITNLVKGEPIGCVGFGSGSIGTASFSTLLKDFRHLLSEGIGDARLNRNAYSIEEVANKLREFLDEEVAKLSQTEPKPSIGIMLGGYSKGATLGEAWELSIQNGVSTSLQRIRQQGDVGINWGGQQEAISRLVHGVSPRLAGELVKLVRPAPQPDQITQLVSSLQLALQAPLAFAPMPIQDAIELAEWLVHTTEMFSRFMPGPQSVGGPIEIAAITKYEGFKWVRRKHYYDSSLNPE